MKIGILIKNFKKLENWELRIIDEIINNPNLKLELLVQDGRTNNQNPNSFKNKFLRLFKQRKIFSTIVFKIQILIEKKIFREVQTTNKTKIITALNKIERVFLKPKRKGFVDLFSKKDSEFLKKYKLDVILRHEFNIIRGPVLESSKYGIWSFHHADNSLNRGGPAGFWEILLKQKSIGVTLQQLTSELDGGLVIDKAFFNRHWSFVLSNRRIYEGSVSLLFKNINNLLKGNFSTKKSIVYYNPLYKSPKTINTIKYLFSFYSKLMIKFVQHLKYIFLGAKYHSWTLFIGKGDFLNSTLFKLKPVKVPKNQFWADPFVLNYKKKDYVFFENYDYKLKKGKISCGLIENQELINITDVMEKDYHLSFPYVFEENEELFLMPETSENNRLELYKCIEFPSKWELYSTAFEGEKIVDTFFYNDHNNQKWLFTNKLADLNSVFDSELFIYKVDSLDLKKITPHRKNPVIINSEIARNAGQIFSFNNKIYRPSQANIEGIYGRALNINKIKKLSIDEYKEKKIVTIFPNFHKGLISTHHLSQGNKLFVIDGAYKKKP